MVSNGLEVKIDMVKLKNPLDSEVKKELFKKLKSLLKIRVVDTHENSNNKLNSQESDSEELDVEELDRLINESPEVLSYQDENGNTLLHLAADHSQVKPVKYLLEKGADPNIINCSNQIPLHTVVDGGDGCHCSSCNKKNVECTELLITRRNDQQNIQINSKDELGDTPLGNAALCLMPECATVLWKNKTDPVDLNIKNVRGNEVGVVVSKFIPQDVYQWLKDEIQPDKDHADYLELNFGALLRASKEKETTFLLYMIKAGKKSREILLLHPLIQAYLYLKWQAVGNMFLLLRAAYLGMSMLYTCFIFSVFLYKCPIEVTSSGDPLTSSTTSASTITASGFNKSSGKLGFSENLRISGKLDAEDNDAKCEATTWIYILTAVLMIFVVCMILNEMFELWYQKMKYFSIRLNYGWWIMIITVILNILPVFMDIVGTWQYPVAAFGIFLAWSMFLTQLARHPRIGVYVEMFGRVCTQFGVFAITYTVLFLGFASGFVVLFPNNGMFETEYNFLPFVKSILMMNGETDYETLFDEGENPLAEDLGYSIGAHIMFVGFILVVTIVLMNLLLGLAIGEIQELSKAAELSKTQRLVEQIDLLETAFNSNWMPLIFTNWYKDSCSIEKQCQLYSEHPTNGQGQKKESKVLSEMDGPIFSFSPFKPPTPGSLPEYLTDEFCPYASAGKCEKSGTEAETEPTLKDLKSEIASLTEKLESFMSEFKK